jgi:hypothetical protein
LPDIGPADLERNEMVDLIVTAARIDAVLVINLMLELPRCVADGLGVTRATDQ